MKLKSANVSNVKTNEMLKFCFLVDNAKLCFRTSGIPIWVMLLNTNRAMLKFCAEASQVLFPLNMQRG